MLNASTDLQNKEAMSYTCLVFLRYQSTKIREREGKKEGMRKFS